MDRGEPDAEGVRRQSYTGWHDLDFFHVSGDVVVTKQVSYDGEAETLDQTLAYTCPLTSAERDEVLRFDDKSFTIDKPGTILYHVSID